LENASRALIIAGGVLIGILVLGLAVVLYTTFREDASTTAEQIEKDRVMQFNSQFSLYIEKSNATDKPLEPYLDIYDVINLASTAKECNRRYGYTSKQDANDNDLYVQIEANTSDILASNNLEEDVNANKNTWLIDNSINSKKYIINKVEYSSVTGRIKYIEIKPKT